MKKFINKKILKACAFIALFAIFFAPALALAEIKLELNYPSLPGITDLSESIKDLPMALRYYVQLGVIIAILVCIISLVWAGISYISSTGQPGAMKQARERIFNTFIGLAILIGSFIILRTISPQMSLLSITKPSIPTGGIVLLSKTGYTSFNGTNFGDLVESGDIKVLGGDSANLALELGKFKMMEYGSPSNSDQEVNYEKFRLYAIGFYGEAASNYKVTLFSDTNFNGLNNSDEAVLSGFQKVFTSGGRIWANEDTLYLSNEEAKYFEPQKRGSGEDQMIIFAISGGERTKNGGVYRNQAMWGPVHFFNLAGTSDTSANVNFPPRSIKIQGFGNGVYLYAKQTVSTGPPLVTKDVEEFFTMSTPKLDDISINFDKKAEQIKIKNLTKMPNGTVKKNDYIAVVYDNTDYEGNMAIYFQTRDTEKSIKDIEKFVPYLYYNGKYYAGQGSLDLSQIVKDGLTDRASGAVFSSLEKDGDKLKSAKFDTFYPGKFSNGSIGTDKVNESPQILFSVGASIYGKLPNKSLSSIQVYELSDDPSVCTKVEICRENNSCISFVPVDTEITPQQDSFQLPIPFYRPVNIPNKISGWMYWKQDNGEYVLQDSKDWYFDNKIASLRIEGKCLVALYEERISFDSNVGNNLGFKGFSTNGGTGYLTGSHSGAFTSSVNLKNTSLYKCGGAGGFFQGGNAGCASAIVVFPIK